MVQTAGSSPRHLNVSLVLVLGYPVDVTRALVAWLHVRRPLVTSYVLPLGYCHTIRIACATCYTPLTYLLAEKSFKKRCSAYLVQP